VNRRLIYAFAGALSAFIAVAAAPQPSFAENDGPSLIGTWSGHTKSIGDIYGLRTRDRTVHITEQTDRRFRGYFVYEGGRRDFFGIVFPDNTSFAWTSAAAKSVTEGRILGDDHIAACYIEAGAEATAGCSDLTRIDTKP
jgi:hypothetical protein